MPLPMVHFGVAMKYTDDKNVPTSFLLGNIAPDAIHMRKSAVRQDKRITHFRVNNIVDIFSLENTYREYILLRQDVDWEWFVRGYFVHVLTDYYWLHSVYKIFKESVVNEQLTNKEIRLIYYKETDQIDYNFYRTENWKDTVWDGLIHTKTFGFDPLLSFDEINYWRLRTIHWFDLLSFEPRVEPKYITQSLVNDFIVETTDQVKRILTEWDSRLFKDVSNIS
jgi:hypothetical protein